MLSLRTKNKYELVTLRKRYKIPITTCGFFILFLPITILMLYILFYSCPTQIIDETTENQLIPLWINKRSQRNLLPNSNNGMIITPNDTYYNPIRDALIFVSIAAFRDIECRNTVLQVIEQAKYPNRLRFGIFTQNNITDKDCADFRDVLNCDSNHDYEYLFAHDNEIPEGANNHGNTWKQTYENNAHILCGRLWQIKTDRVDWKDGLGPTYGRYRAELFYDNEEYVLQMDSHTAFAQDWDILLIKMHLSLNNDYGVITTYPKPLRYPTLWHWKATNGKINSQMYVICSTQILKDKVTKSFKLKPARIISNTGEPILTAYFAAGFSFQKGHRLINVPYDPYSAYLFDGEEMSMAVRMWTHGYDFYTPNIDIVYHLYSPNDAKIRPVFWEFQWNIKWKIARDSEYRINYILNLHRKFHPNVPLNKYDLREIHKYGIGNKRNVDDFWNFTRIDLDNYESEDLCNLYKNGGMAKFRIAWNNKTQDPYHPI
eukprot:16454_1